jgi:hypothetical protein
MEHRDPSRSAGEDPRTGAVAHGVQGRLEPPQMALPRPSRRGLDRGRMLRLAVWLVAGLIGAVLAYRAGIAAVAWLGEQPAYQVPFRSIVLDPPPPTWYRGGSAGFLENVRQRARMPETIPLLKFNDRELEDVFKLSPWTQEVLKITRRPLGLTIRLNYHRPVAIVPTPSHQEYLVDRSAIILPLEEVDRERLEHDHDLIRIDGEGLMDPLDPQPGLAWKPQPGLTDIAAGNHHIADAAEVAYFLEEKSHSLDRVANPSLNIRSINPMDKHPEYRGQFLCNAESTYILWGEAPGQEGPKSLGAEEKWKKLVEWSRTEKNRILPYRHYWEITAAGVVHVDPSRPASDSARMTRPARDRSAIRAIGPGQ